MKHSHLITLLHRQHAIAREINCLVNANTPSPMAWRHPLEGLNQVAQCSRPTREVELLEALVSVQMVVRMKAEVEWSRLHQAGQAICPEGRWQ